MASSSDWIDALGEELSAEDQGEPAWMAALRGPADFVEGASFGIPGPRKPAEPQGKAPAEGPEEPEEDSPDLIAEAYARGRAEGRSEAMVEQAEKTESLHKLRISFRAFDQAATDAFASELAETVISLCGKALADFAADPETLLARCKEASQRLGSAASECKLHLHPSDLAALDPASIEGWEVVADESVARCGLRFEGPDGAISHGPDDWRRAIASAIRG